MNVPKRTKRTQRASGHGSGSAQISTNMVHTTFFHESCNQEPGMTQASNDVVREGGVPRQYMASDNRITYENPKYLRFGDCMHIQDFTHESDGLVQLVHIEESEINHPWNGSCGAFSCIRETINGEVVLVIKDPTLGSAIAGVLPPGEVICESFFQSYERKVLQRMALDNMMPDFENGLRGLVFIFELRELPRMLVQLKEWVPELISALKSLFKDRSLKEVSSLWLSCEFGHMPFFSDLEKILTRLWNLKKDLNRFLNNENKRQTLHFRWAVDPHVLHPAFGVDVRTKGSYVTQTETGYMDFASDVYHTATLETDEALTVTGCKYHATLEFMYQLVAAEEMKRLYLTLDRFGLNLNLEDLWEILPFSFVVDWVLGVGNYLSQFQVKQLEPDIVVYDFCESIVYTYMRAARFTGLRELRLSGSEIYEDPSAWMVFDLGTAHIARSHVYCRRRSMPMYCNDAGVPSWKLPNGRNLIDGTALWSSRRR